MIVLLGVLVVFELTEHLLLPLLLAWRMRKRRPVSGAEAMVGKVVEIRSWRGHEGQVMADGELWSATCTSELAPGDRAAVRRVDGLVLEVERIAKG